MVDLLIKKWRSCRVLSGVVMLQVARNMKLRRRLDERRAVESVDVEEEEAG